MSGANAYAKRPSLAAVSFLKTMAKRTLRIAATADLHYAKHSRGTMQDAFAEISRSADVLLLCGDLTEYGLPEEAEELAADIRSAVRIPCIGVIGNHDYESGKPETVANILDQTGVTMLNGEAVEIAGVGFAGICGFGGGFGRRMLNAWGEPLIKQFVQESISHAIRLEQALVKLQTDRRIVVLHYSPIRATLQGEDPEIYAFLGSSRLEEQPIPRHRGIPRSRTQRNYRRENFNWHSRLQRLSACAAQNRKALPHRRTVRRRQPGGQIKGSHRPLDRTSHSDQIYDPKVKWLCKEFVCNQRLPRLYIGPALSRRNAAHSLNRVESYFRKWNAD